jgi:hypothetical protein
MADETVTDAPLPATMRGPVAWMAQNPVAANLLLLIVVIAGLFAIQTLDKEVFPSFPTETFTVTVPYPGSSPEEVERGIILRVEEAVRDIVGIKEIRSEAREGVGIVTVIMEPGSDMSKAVNLAKVRVDGIASFPADAEKPIVEEIEAATAPSASACSAISRRASSRSSASRSARKSSPWATSARSACSASGTTRSPSSCPTSAAPLRPDLRRRRGGHPGALPDLPGGQLRTDSGAITLRSTSQAYAGREFEQLTLISRRRHAHPRGRRRHGRDGFAEQPVLSLVNGKPALTFASSASATRTCWRSPR